MYPTGISIDSSCDVSSDSLTWESSRLRCALALVVNIATRCSAKSKGRSGTSTRSASSFRHSSRWTIIGRFRRIRLTLSRSIRCSARACLLSLSCLSATVKASSRRTHSSVFIPRSLASRLAMSYSLMVVLISGLLARGAKSASASVSKVSRRRRNPTRPAPASNRLSPTSPCPSKIARPPAMSSSRSIPNTFENCTSPILPIMADITSSDRGLPSQAISAPTLPFHSRSGCFRAFLRMTAS